MPMRAGLLRQVVQILKPTVTGGIQNWTLLDTVRAEISPVTGAEVARALDPTTTVLSNVVIRYHANIRPKDRLQFGTRILEVISVINIDERNRELNLVCKEGVS